MAIVDDIKGDKRTKVVLDQTNTKTVGPPQTSTGLTGDQLPSNVFTADDFDLVRNQINLEAVNFQLIDVLNKMGQITNMQSQSGPIVGTGKVEVFTLSGNATVAVLTPPAGQAFRITAMSTGLMTGGSISVGIGNSDGLVALLDSTSTANAPLPGDDFNNSAVDIVSPQNLSATTTGSPTGLQLIVAYHSVR